MLVYRLGKQEVQRLRAIRLSALLDAPEAFCSTHAGTAVRPLDSWYGELDRLPTFVAVLDGVDVGMVRTIAHESKARVQLLRSMWVAPAARRVGVGAALVDAIIAYARREGARVIQLEVADDNRSAIELYARKGFVPTGHTDCMPPPRQDHLLHERELVL